MLLPARREYANPRHLPRGTRLGLDLTLGHVLGEGGTGIVYSAYHDVLHREVAVKMCHAHGIDDGREARARLSLEAQMCASVRDPRVPKIFSLDRLEDGTPYVVMEKVAGETLTELILRDPPCPRLACTLVMELLGALISVHRAGVVHRDVKPSNLMVDVGAATPRLKLLDFGIGKTFAPRPQTAPLTRRGAVLGTPLYMAPEQILEGAVDERADVYAAGVVMFELLAGRPPYRASSVAEIFACVLRDDMPSLSTLRPDLSEALVAVVRQATEKKPDARFACARDMATALREAVALGLPQDAPHNPARDAFDLQVTVVPSASGPCARASRPAVSVRPAWLARTLRAPKKRDRLSDVGHQSMWPPMGFCWSKKSRAVASV